MIPEMIITLIVSFILYWIVIQIVRDRDKDRIMNGEELSIFSIFLIFIPSIILVIGFWGPFSRILTSIAWQW
jgi:heme/copper-type cytochrome/quinol oxidase subunit 2